MAPHRLKEPDLRTWYPEDHRRAGRTRSETKRMDIGLNSPEQRPLPTPPTPAQPSAPEAGFRSIKLSPAANSETTGPKLGKRSAPETDLDDEKAQRPRKKTRIAGERAEESRNISSEETSAKLGKRSSSDAVVDDATASQPSKKTRVAADGAEETKTSEEKSERSKLGKRSSSEADLNDTAPRFPKKPRAAARRNVTISKEKPKPKPKPKLKLKKLTNRSAQSPEEVTFKTIRRPSPYRGTAKPTEPGWGSHLEAETPARKKKIREALVKRKEEARKRKAAMQAPAKPVSAISNLPVAKGASDVDSKQAPKLPSTNGLTHLRDTNREWRIESHEEKMREYRKMSSKQKEKIDELLEELINASIGKGDITAGEITLGIREHMQACTAARHKEYEKHESERERRDAWMRRARTSLVSCADRERRGPIHDGAR